MRMSVRARDAFKPSLQVLCKPVFSLLFSAASFFPFFVAPSKLVRHRLELSCRGNMALIGPSDFY